MKKSLYKLAIVLIILIIAFSVYCLKDRKVSSIIHDSKTSLVNPQDKDIDEHCPPYKPDGATYSGCLSELSDAKDTEANNLLKEIIGGKQGANETVEEHNQLLVSLLHYNDVWLDYRKAFCDLDNISSAAGSGYYQFISKCEIRETQKYLNLLKSLKVLR